MNYSQNNEQEVILAFFKEQKGRFLDIGAHDGKSLSNTRALAERGWHGVLVEPNPVHFIKLWELYGGNKHYTLVNAAIDSCNKGLIELKYNYEGPAYSSTLSEEKAIEFKANDYSKSFYVPVCGVRELVRFGPYDFVSIDIEGMEVPVLAQASGIFNMTSLICVEFCKKTKATIETQISWHGFSIINQTPENLIAVRQ